MRPNCTPLTLELGLLLSKPFLNEKLNGTTAAAAAAAVVPINLRLEIVECAIIIIFNEFILPTCQKNAHELQHLIPNSCLFRTVQLKVSWSKS
ncbi:hypothetical protein ES708_34592 [subsurface metagenome]